MLQDKKRIRLQEQQRCLMKCYIPTIHLVICQSQSLRCQMEIENLEDTKHPRVGEPSGMREVEIAVITE